MKNLWWIRYNRATPEAARSALCVNNKLREKKRPKKRALQQTMNTNEGFRDDRKWWIAQYFRGFDDRITVMHNFRAGQNQAWPRHLRRFARMEIYATLLWIYDMFTSQPGFAETSWIFWMQIFGIYIPKHLQGRMIRIILHSSHSNQAFFNLQFNLSRTSASMKHCVTCISFWM